MLKLKSISDIRTEKVRTDNKESRKYYVATFQDASNPFAKPAKRTIFQQHDTEGKASWVVGDPKELIIGMLIPGEIKSAAVKPYSIGEGADMRTVTTYSTAVFGNEILASVFKQAGHELAGTEEKSEVAKRLEALEA